MVRLQRSRATIQGPQAVRFDYAYDPNFTGKVISITPKNPATGAVDPDWQAWQYDYHQAGSACAGSPSSCLSRSKRWDNLDTLATYTYNSAGQVLTVTDGSGAVTTYAYDSDDWRSGFGDLIRKILMPARIRLTSMAAMQWEE